MTRSDQLQQLCKLYPPRGDFFDGLESLFDGDFCDSEDFLILTDSSWLVFFFFLGVGKPVLLVFLRFLLLHNKIGILIKLYSYLCGLILDLR